MGEPFDGAEIAGQFESKIVGLAYHAARAEPGVPLRFRRQPDNPHDTNAILVLDEQGQAVGHLPRDVAVWLASLLDEGQIRLGGQVTRPPSSPSQRSCPITLDVLWTAPTNPLSEPQLSASTPGDAAFELVRHAYRLAAVQTSGGVGKILANWVRPMAQQCPYPEARLLCALLPDVARRSARRVAHAALAGIIESLLNLRLGNPLRQGSLSVFPVFAAQSDGDRPAYALLEESVRRGWVDVDEVGGHGVVSRLEVRNRGDRPVLIIQGELIVGLKQNRMVSRTVLVAAGSTLMLPVRCVEQGRWQHHATSWASAAPNAESPNEPSECPPNPPPLRSPPPPAIELCAPPRVRRASLISNNAAERDQHVDQQGEVWREVDAALAENEVCSSSSSLSDAHAAARARLEDSRRLLMPPSDAIGFIIGQGDSIVGMDLFDSPATLETFATRLLDGYLVQYRRAESGGKMVTEMAARGFLARVARGLERAEDQPGLGNGLVLDSEGTSGCGLALEGRLCHLAALGAPVD